MHELIQKPLKLICKISFLSNYIEKKFIDRKDKYFYSSCIIACSSRFNKC